MKLAVPSPSTFRPWVVNWLVAPPSSSSPLRKGSCRRPCDFPVWHARLVPDLAGRPLLVHDLARNLVSDFAVANVWTGTGALDLFSSEFEELATLAPVTEAFAVLWLSH